MKAIDTVPAWAADGLERNAGTVWQVVKAYRANLRQGTVGVKTRAAVRATGKKPYRQKKTGNARRGSFVSPLHVGGGVAHGPKARSYRQRITPKMGALALKIALAHRARDGKVLSAAALSFDAGKTKVAHAALLAAHPDLGLGKTLVCLEGLGTDRASPTFRALRNIRGVVLVSPESLNAFHVVQSRVLVTTHGTLDVIGARLTRMLGEGEGT